MTLQSFPGKNRNAEVNKLTYVYGKMFTVATFEEIQGDVAVYEICASTRLSTGVKVIFLFAFPFECWGKGN